MIIQVEDQAQLSKLQQAHVANSHANEDLLHRRPSSALSAVTLPDYEASQKAHNSPLPTRPRFYPLSPFRRSDKPPSRSRRCLLIVYYLFLAYAIIGSIVLIPILVWKLRQSNQPDDGSPPGVYFDPPSSLNIPLYDEHTKMSLMDVGNATLLCNSWIQGPPIKTKDGPPSSSASLNFTFPIPSSFRLFTDGSDDARGQLLVNLNPDKKMKEIVFSATASYSDPSFFNGTSLCFSQSNNMSSVSLHVPKNAHDSAFAVNMTILLPNTSSSQLKLPKFATYAPNFKQRVGRISPSVTFSNVALESGNEAISFDSIVADTLVVKTTNAKVSGNMNVTGALSVDTISAPIDANISLVNYDDCNGPTTAELDTGNSPLAANFILAAQGSPRWPQFLLKASTFNAPLNLTLSHAPTSPPVQMFVHAITAAGPLSVSADALFAGTFDLQTKAAGAHVYTNGTTKDVKKMGSSTTDPCEVQFDYSAGDRLVGWAGHGKRPVPDNQSNLRLETSLADVQLALYETRGVPWVRT